jgi:DeoR/GlpR family transcriptional regulator of sugar metabolism
VNVLADSSKFAKLGAFQAGPVSPGLRIFSDPGLPREARSRLEAAGVEVIV